ncbi:hypothetical protein RZS08_36735, partial [Arthrospira platensis SPKY1]|nr:hypothetical protein [Arthrospira platensis SPKY1]
EIQNTIRQELGRKANQQRTLGLDIPGTSPLPDFLIGSFGTVQSFEQIQQQYEQGIPIVGEKIHSVQGVVYSEELVQFGVMQNAVFASNIQQAAQQIAEIKIWKQFAVEQLKLTPEQIANGDLRIWIA